MEVLNDLQEPLNHDSPPSRCQKMYLCVKGRWWFDLGKFLVTIALALLIGFYTIRQEINDLQARLESFDNTLRYVEGDITDIQVSLQPLNSSLVSLQVNIVNLNDTVTALDLNQLTQNVTLLTEQVSNLTLEVKLLDQEVSSTSAAFTASSEQALVNLSQYNASIWTNLLNWSAGFELSMEENLQEAQSAVVKATPIFWPALNVFATSNPISQLVNIATIVKQNCSVGIFQYAYSCSCSNCGQLTAALSFVDPVSQTQLLRLQNSWTNTPNTFFRGVYEALVPIDRNGNLNITFVTAGNLSGTGANVWSIGCFLR